MIHKFIVKGSPKKTYKPSYLTQVSNVAIWTKFAKDQQMNLIYGCVMIPMGIVTFSGFTFE